MKQFHRFTLYTLNFTLLFAAAIGGAAKASPLATQDWTRRTFYDAIQETGRTNVLTAADRQMISNYIDEVARLYAGRDETIPTDEVVFANGKILYTVGSTVQTNEVAFGCRPYTNAALRVTFSTLAEVPAGTIWAYDRANSRYVNGSAAPPVLDAAWVYSLNTSMVWRTTGAGRYLATNIATRCFMKLSAASGASEWYSQQAADTWTVYRLDGGVLAGSFKVVAHSISDDRRDALLSGSRAGSASFSSFVLRFAFPPACASVYNEPPGSEDAGEFFLSVKIDDLYYEVVLPEMAWFRPVGKVDDTGAYTTDASEYVPCPWESRDDWCDPANRWGETVNLMIPFKTPGGTVDYVQKELSPARLLRNFPELGSRLAAMYRAPEKLVPVEPCSVQDNGHDWATDEDGCYCRKCGLVRPCVFGHLNGDESLCKTCLNFLGPEYSGGEEVVHEETDARCGRVSPNAEDHTGWHQGARVVNVMSDVNYWLYQCTCQCGWFGQDHAHMHDFPASQEGVVWEPGEDESGANADTYHHGELLCQKMWHDGRHQCDGAMVVKELHDCLNPDGTVPPGSRVYPVKDVGGAVTECAADDPDANRSYHGQDGTCRKCDARCTNLAMHAPDAGNGCRCPCGMVLHTWPDSPDGCGNYRCTVCDAFLYSEYGHDDEEKHFGFNRRDGDAENHWCNCGKTSEPHEGHVRTNSDGSKYCERCGYQFEATPDGDSTTERYRARYYPNIRNGQPQGDGVSMWSNGGGGGGTQGDLEGDVPDGVSPEDLRKASASEVVDALLQRGWSVRRFAHSTRRYWFNLWMKTDVWTVAVVMTNAQGQQVEFTYVYDTGLTFWE